MAPGAYFRHPAVLEHDIPGHPERPERIRVLEAALEERDRLGFEWLEAPRATREQLLRVHPASHVDHIEALCARGGGFIDADTAAVSGTWEAALRSAGGAIAVVDTLLSGSGSYSTAVSATRPPGHHAASDRAMGFCFFANVAIAARHALGEHGLERVLILDWDVHHGNGTNDIFHAASEVLFASLHEYPLYPGTGPASDVGSGEGVGYTLNFPMPGGSTDEAWSSVVEHAVVPIAREYAPQLILISAGFDAHALDPLATCRLSENGYVAMAGSMRRLADELSAPVGLVLEGGYSTQALAESMCALLPVLAGDEPPPELGYGMHGLAIAARERLDRFWPGLTSA